MAKRSRGGTDIEDDSTKTVSIGDVTVFDGEPEGGNPYNPPNQLTGDDRSDGLRRLRDDADTNVVAHATPTAGGAHRIRRADINWSGMRHIPAEGTPTTVEGLAERDLGQGASDAPDSRYGPSVYDWMPVAIEYARYLQHEGGLDAADAWNTATTAVQNNSQDVANALRDNAIYNPHWR